MKTIFKVEMEVYDQLNFPDKKGVVVEVCNDEEDEYPIGVSFESKNGRYYYTTEGRFRKGDTPTLSTKPYKVEFQGFEQKAPAPTFEEAWAKTDRIYKPKSKYCKEEFGGYPSQELADASEALRRLLFLRVYYNEFYQPDCDETCYNDEFVIEPSSANYPNVLSFESKKTRKRFFEEQKELLEIAKPLFKKQNDRNKRRNN